MSFMRGDLLTRTGKLVKGLAKAEPVWFKAMKQAPPPMFPRADGKINKITLPEDVYIKKFYQKHSDSKYEDAFKWNIGQRRRQRRWHMLSLKKISRLQGKRPPPNLYPSAIKEIQAEERKYVRDRFFNDNVRKLVQKLKVEKEAEAQDRIRGGGW
ncbi:RNA-binding protein [Quillaja saponaria]|uniref:Small ribosomal subunit protein mS23 n=1 Tax=Quillaja saponaria TaxID=32244 RepID=A0AAD7PGA7_QUISA|nr:RNA-binding protein [Quillaja saponaria]